MFGSAIKVGIVCCRGFLADLGFVCMVCRPEGLPPIISRFIRG